MLAWSSRLVLIVVPACCFLAGCGDDGPQIPDRPPSFPIVGKVTVNGSTVELPKMLGVVAIPEGAKRNLEGDVVGVGSAIASPQDGTFSISTYEKGDGVPAGTYKLTFRLGKYNMMKAGFEGDDFKGKYDNPETSEYTVTVTGNETEPIDLGEINLTLDE